MNTAPNDIDDLIANYLSGEATSDQIAFLDEWKNENEANHRYFEQLKLIFEKAGSTPLAEQFDTDKAWQKLRSRLSQQSQGKTIHLQPRRAPYKFFLRLAAGIIFVIIAGFFSYRFLEADPVHAVALISDKQSAPDTLPDGSGVYLNRKTRIDYSFNKKKNIHTAKLVGEAYFNIHHDEDKIFIVETEGVFIKDIGTSFNVKAYPGSPTIEVVVEEGAVMFYTGNNPGVFIKAKGKGVYNKKTKTFTASEPEPNVTAYKTKFFTFIDLSLATVVETLNAVYAEKIEIDKNLKDCRLTVSFNNENIDEIAGIIAETLGLTVSRSENTIRLKGPGCGNLKP